MATVKRYDKGELRKAKKLDNGWVEADAYVTRTGVFEYSNSAKTWKEYRPPDEVFHQDSLESFELRPLTNDHPPELLTAENIRVFQVGSVARPTRDGDMVRTKLLVTDPATIKDMEEGKLELSAGYLCDVLEEPGVSPSGERYDCVQKNIRANHVALVHRGRAGSEVRARMDSTSGYAVTFQADSAEFGKDRKAVKKIRLDGVEVEVEETVAQLIEKAEAKHAEALKTAETKVEQMTARADSLDAELKATKAEVAAAPEKIRAEIKARVALESKAREILGDEAKFDSASDLEIKKQVVAAVSPDLKLEGKSDVYVEASYDIALVRHSQENSGAAQVLAAIHADGAGEQPNDAETQFKQRIANAYKASQK